MKTLNLIFAAIIVVSIIGAVAVYTSNRNSNEEIVGCTMDALICGDGTAVGRTGPDCSFPECPTPSVPPSPTPDPEVPDDIEEYIEEKADLIVVNSPRPNEAVSTPLLITGEARGYWFFEATFPIVIVDWNGLIIGEGYATAGDEWMTEDFVPFTATVAFDLPSDTPYRRGAIILQKSNASGLPEHDDALEIPITFK